MQPEVRNMQNFFEILCAEYRMCSQCSKSYSRNPKKKANPNSHLTLHDPQTYICRSGLFLTIQSIKLFHVNQMRIYSSHFVFWIPKRKDLRYFSLGRGFNWLVHNAKQLLNEVEHEIMNYQKRGLCCRLRQIIQARGFDNSWHHAKIEFNNCFLYILILRHRDEAFSHCFCGEHFKGLGNQTDFELDMTNTISAADIAFIMSSSQAILNWLNAWHVSIDQIFHSKSDV